MQVAEKAKTNSIWSKTSAFFYFVFNIATGLSLYLCGQLYNKSECQ